VLRCAWSFSFFLSLSLSFVFFCFEAYFIFVPLQVCVFMVGDVDKLSDPGVSELDSLIGEAHLRVYGDKRTAELQVMITGQKGISDSFCFFVALIFFFQPEQIGRCVARPSSPRLCSWSFCLVRNDLLAKRCCNNPGCVGVRALHLSCFVVQLDPKADPALVCASHPSNDCQGAR
jgi:hypothetical protein